MNTKELKNMYKLKEKEINSRLESFKNLSEKEMQKELFFCLLTPQSQAKKCWQAVEQLPLNKSLKKRELAGILKAKTRFHNNKASYIIKASKMWNKIKQNLNNPNTKELRNWLAENVSGFGLKEASHFLRNIGKSRNQIAILDRHILKNLKANKVIKEDKIKNKADYLKKEQKFLDFADKISISPDALDLLFWSSNAGEIFK